MSDFESLVAPLPGLMAPLTGVKKVHCHAKASAPRGTASFRRASRLSFKLGRSARAAADDLEQTLDIKQGYAEGVSATVHEVAPRDPVARPTYQPRLEGAARPMYQPCEEFAIDQAGSSDAAIRVSPAIDVDIHTFLQAVSSAFPHPRDPQVRPILRVRPARAARPFLFVAGTDDVEMTPAPVMPEVQDGKVQGRSVAMETSVELNQFPWFDEPSTLKAWDGPLEKLTDAADQIASFDQPYDPILDDLHPLNARTTPAVGTAGADERQLIEAEIEPLEPVGNPRLPLPPEGAIPGVQTRLSPSQRAHLARPATVRDCNGQLAPVTYRMGGARKS